MSKIRQKVSISKIIIKVCNKCNFNCPYCYMFKHADQSYKNKPAIISSSTIQEIIIKAGNYLKKYNLNNQEIIFHGGEPLLLGYDKLKHLFSEFSKLQNNFPEIKLAIQSNTSLVNKQVAELLNTYKVSCGTSLDGYPQLQQKIKTKAGAETYPLIVKGIKWLQEHAPDYFAGVLCVIDLEAEPLRIYNHFLDLGLKKMDFLFPMRNHLLPLGYNQENNDYFKWLKPIFDQWLEDDDDTVDIRLFSTIIKLLASQKISDIKLSHSALDTITIDTDGSIQLVDDLRICGDNFTDLNLNIYKDEIDQYFKHPRIIKLLEAENNPAAKCQQCDYLYICGNGVNVFSYGSDQTFNWPSIYCNDLLSLYKYIEQEIGEIIENEISLAEKNSD